MSRSSGFIGTATLTSRKRYAWIRLRFNSPFAKGVIVTDRILTSVILPSQLERRKEKGLLPKECNIDIRKEVSAIENFIRLNKISNNSRKLAPLTPPRLPFVSFTEKKLVGFFYKDPSLKVKVQHLAKPDFPATELKPISLADVIGWIGDKEPGFLIKRLLSDVAKEGLTKRQRGKGGHKAAVK